MNVSSLFQLLLKGCTIEASSEVSGGTDIEFQLLLKGCTIEAKWGCLHRRAAQLFQLLLKGCTIEARLRLKVIDRRRSFSCC